MWFRRKPPESPSNRNEIVMRFHYNRHTPQFELINNAETGWVHCAQCQWTSRPMAYPTHDRMMSSFMAHLEGL